MSQVTRICPECLSAVTGLPACSCGARLPAGCGTALPAAGLTWWSLLDQRHHIWPALGRSADGPRLYPHDISEARSAVCWRHRGRTFWVWLQTPEALPPAGHVNASHAQLAAMRAVALGRFVLLEAPQPTPLFRAHYARLPHSKGQPPPVAHVLDRLEAAWSVTAIRPHAVALVDRRGATAEDRARLRHAANHFAVFGDREPALAWLLDRATEAGIEAPVADGAATEHPESPHHTTGDSRAEPASLATGATVPSPSGAAAASPESAIAASFARGNGARDVVRIVDIGGCCGRHLLARLHEETARLYEQASEEDRQTGTVGSMRLGPFISAWPRVTGAGVRWGRVQRLGCGEPAPDDVLPAWSAAVSTWRRRRPLVVDLDRKPTTPEPVALMIGVGPSRLYGERSLVDVLETVWSNARVPAAVVRHLRADATLLRWVGYELPHVPQFPDTWDGNVRALAAALRLARKLGRP